MSDKKPDFDSLDFTDLQKKKDVPAPVEEVAEKKPAKKLAAPKKRAYNAWINGLPIEDTSAEDMGDWVHRLIGVELNLKDLDNPNKRVKTIDKVLHINKKLSFMNIGHHNTDQKVYKN